MDLKKALSDSLPTQINQGKTPQGTVFVAAQNRKIKIPHTHNMEKEKKNAQNEDRPRSTRRQDAAHPERGRPDLVVTGERKMKTA
jgi:hypothetical protein